MQNAPLCPSRQRAASFIMSRAIKKSTVPRNCSESCDIPNAHLLAAFSVSNALARFKTCRTKQIHETSAYRTQLLLPTLLVSRIAPGNDGQHGSIMSLIIIPLSHQRDVMFERRLRSKYSTATVLGRSGLNKQQSPPSSSAPSWLPVSQSGNCLSDLGAASTFRSPNSHSGEATLR